MNGRWNTIAQIIQTLGAGGIIALVVILLLLNPHLLNDRAAPDERVNDLAASLRYQSWVLDQLAENSVKQTTILQSIDRYQKDLVEELIDERRRDARRP